MEKWGECPALGHEAVSLFPALGVTLIMFSLTCVPSQQGGKGEEQKRVDPIQQPKMFNDSHHKISQPW